MIIFDKNKALSPLKQRIYWLILTFCVLNFSLLAQNVDPDEQVGLLKADSIPSVTDTVPKRLITDTIKLASGAIDARVVYACEDSMISYVSKKLIYLYGNASVEYLDLKIKADFIRMNLDSNLVEATFSADSLGNKIGIPEFSQGEQNFTAGNIRYNFETGKGKIFDITTQQNDVVVKGRELKFIRSLNDTSQADILYNSGGIFTTCTHPEPHFGIRASKQKIIANRLVVAGPSNLEIMGVPTPIILPFAFFPLKQGRRTGLLFPRDYEYSQQWGFGLRDIGWFFPLGEHYNLTLRSDIYLKGTFGMKANMQYNRRYKYSGSFNIGFDNRRSESSEGLVTRQSSIRLAWTHQQAAAAHPTNKFGGSINMQFQNDYQGLVNNDANNVLNNSLNSNFGFSKRWRDKPYNLNITLSHNQNRRSNRMDITYL